jgi:hypothetical protein
MTHADIQIATYQDAIHLIQAASDHLGPMPQWTCRFLVQEIEDRIKDVIDAECHRKVVESMAS